MKDINIIMDIHNIENTNFIFDLCLDQNTINDIDSLLFEKILIECTTINDLLKYFSECYLRAESITESDINYKKIVHLQLRNYILLNDDEYIKQIIPNINDDTNHYFDIFVAFLHINNDECFDMINDIDININHFKIKYIRDLIPTLGEQTSGKKNRK